MADKNLYINDLIHRFASHTFTETTVESETKVEFKDGGSVVIAEHQNLNAIDAYRTIRRHLLSGATPAFLSTTTERDTLTNVEAGTPICNISTGAIETFDGIAWSNAAGTGFTPTFKVRVPTTIQTTDSTQTTIDSFTVDDGEVYLVKIFVVGIRSDFSDRGGFIKTATVYGASGSANIEGAITTDHSSTSNNSYDGDITVSGSSVRVSVTGFSGHTINWKCFMQFIEV